MIGLAGRVAVVTGSSRGIGFAIARRLAGDGARVVMNGRDAVALESAVSALRSTGADVIGEAGDVGSAEDVARLFRRTEEEFGVADIVVNNAALADPVRHLLDLDREFWDQVIRSNLTGVYECTRRGAQAMVGKGLGGTIVSISSFGAIRAHRSKSAYDAAKGGVEAFTRAAALDLAPFGIRVNAVAPGPIRSDSEASHPDNAAARAAVVPLGRIGEPEEIADAVRFLVSSESSFITGQCLAVDGGVLAQLRPAAMDPGAPIGPTAEIKNSISPLGGGSQ